ncbi:MAG: hypothetical protein COA71_11880 [SAR86 cluster bacterium]|uniref:Replication initiation factor n=1 Tax=SAR86 cluster bacterium TaxID=2030880 RepID=A0A2A5C9S7_9GAMM|nr:hypothetical protein [Gammaproteobacteria bacterium AH-315-E17]PCJ40200.1 MAG: hypothetical protein COA71_11880 [SAR86 cluster bacterium]
MSSRKTKPAEASLELGAPAEQGTPDQDGISQGTAPSNTVPSNYNNQTNTTVLRTGIDSLYLSFPGELSQESSKVLDKLKEYARSLDPETTSLAQIELAGHLFYVSDKGRSVYSYVLRNNWYEIQVSKLGADRLPLAYVKIPSELLTLKPLSSITEDLTQVVSSLGLLKGIINLSRVDLCADFITDFPLSAVADSDWITRARGISRHSVSKRFSGFSIGLGGKLSARLYDKTLEMQSKPRPYLAMVWGASGWDGEQVIWRLEFQFRRNVLKELNTPTCDLLEDHLAGLWNYATCHWLRLAISNDTDTNPTRWPTAHVWEILRTAPWSGNADFPRVDVEKGRLPSNKTLFENGLSGYTSFMAREGYAKADDGMRAYYLAAKAYHDAREPFTGKDFQDYVLEKIKVKQRLFSTAVNVRSKKTALEEYQETPESYRRKKDGE